MSRKVHLFFDFGIALILIRVQLAGELAIRLFDVLLRGIGGHAQEVVQPTLLDTAALHLMWWWLVEELLGEVFFLAATKKKTIK